MSRWIGPLRLIGLGWYIAICIAVGLVAGIWVDSALHVTPLFTFLGLFLGLAAAFIGVYRMVASAVQDVSGDTESKEDA